MATNLSLVTEEPGYFGIDQNNRVFFF